MAEVDCTVQYRDIPGLPGRRVGTDGSVWTCWHLSGKFMTDRWRPKKAEQDKRPDRMPYARISFSVNGKSMHFSVHHLVLITFVGPCPEGMECRHLNGDPTDNRLENLDWGTKKQNRADRTRHGRNCAGEAHTNAKLTDEDVLEIRRLYSAKAASQNALSVAFGVSHGLINGIVTRRQWQHLP